jgi:hypothetical protein
MHKNLRAWLFAGLLLTVASCGDDDNIAPVGKYDNGFFMVSEGNFGVASGDLNFYDYENDSLLEYVYTAENPGKKLGTPSTSMEFGAIHDGKLYLVGKYKGPFVVLNAGTLKETARIDSVPGHDGRSFLGLDNNRGLLSTSLGVYPVTLSPLSLGVKIPGVDGEVGDMIRGGNYIFVMSVKDGIVALNANDYSVAKKLGTAVAGFVQSKDGYIWAASTTQLKKINASTLAVDSITTGFPVFFNQWTYYSSSIVASTADNAIFVVSDNNKVYRYTGDAASLSTPFITLPAGQYFYGKGIGYDKSKNYLVLNSNTDVYGGHPDNTIYIHNATTGALIRSKNYEGYFFPGMAVFH